MIIAISGKKNSGKDTIADIIMSLYPEKNFKILKFADTLKDIVCLLLKCSREQLEDRNFKEQSLDLDWNIPKSVISPRTLLEYIGTDMFRNMVSENIWVDCTLKNLDISQNYIITDLRFSNEFEEVKKLGGTTVRIERFDKIDYEEPYAETALDFHRPYFDIIINNKSGLHSLFKEIQSKIIL